MKKHREIIENTIPRDHIVYVEICKTIKNKAMQDTQKPNFEIQESRYCPAGKCTEKSDTIGTRP